MVRQTLELKHKKIEKETVISMLVEMKMNGMPKQTIVKVAKKKNLSDEDINRILDSKEEIE